MPKTYAYTLDFPKEDARRMEVDWRRAGLSRSAIFRMSIDDIPAADVITRLTGLEIRRPTQKLKALTFTIWQVHRDKLDLMKNNGVELAFVLRHSLVRYLEMDVEDLRRIPGSMVGVAKQRKLIEGDALRKKLGNLKEPEPHGAVERIAIAQDPVKRKAITIPPIPVRSPDLDWGKVGPVQPPDETSPDAQRAAEDFQPTPNLAKLAGLPSDALEGVDLSPSGSDPESGIVLDPKPPSGTDGSEEARSAPATEPPKSPAPGATLSPLEILRRKKQ